MKIWTHFALSVFGFLFFVAGFLLRQQSSSIIQKKLGEALVISPNSPMLDSFITPPIPIYMDFNFFNVTNPEDILRGAKPRVSEMGPYVYLQKRRKHDMNWTDTSVEFLENTKFVFQPDFSGNSRESDMITTINPVFITLAAKFDNPQMMQGFHGLLEIFKHRFDVQIFITRSVGELLFNGYEEKMLSELFPLTNNPLHKTGRFGFFYPKNDSDSGPYSVLTGADGLENLQVIESWKGNSKLDYWSDEYCDMINGTTGGQFPQPVLPERNISLFSADLCRSLYLTYESERNFGGLTLIRYALPYEVLANRTENECYCIEDFTCKSALVNLSPCRGGAPVIASPPHFYMADSEVVDAVEGLNPSKELHETYLDVEPNTGVTFKAIKRIQISMPLRRYADLPKLSQVNEVILPILWLNERAEVPEERAIMLHGKLTKPIILMNYISFALFAIGTILVVIPIVSFIISKKSSAREVKVSDTVATHAESEALSRQSDLGK